MLHRAARGFMPRQERVYRLRRAKATVTPVVRPTTEMIANDTPLDTKKVTHFRGLAARSNYLAADRPDCAYAAKEICRWMSAPTDLGLQGLRRLARYLVVKPRLVWEYRWQDVRHFDVYSDTDWAGCGKTRKSTSGGCILLGTRLIKSRSSTQSNIALSSGEAEYYACVKGGSRGLDTQSMLHDFGIQGIKIKLKTDANAAQGIASRRGLGSIRHIETHLLWLQQKINNGSIKLEKVKGYR